MHLTAMIEAGGHVTIGRVEPFDGIAIAANTQQVFAVLRRRSGETLGELLQRLEDALEHAAHGGEPINEVGSDFVLAPPSTRDKR